MGKSIKLREVSPAEEEELAGWVRSGKTEQRLARRARIVLLKQQGMRTQTIAAQVGCDPDRVAEWVRRFNEQGVQGLYDQPGRGRKMTYTELERGEMVAIAKTHPQHLGLAFGYWSSRRLVRYLKENKGIGISRAQLARILAAEGIKWYQEQTYFTERPDPQFAEKRGRL